jgi:tRNA threonylcarbamoyl adenosine modification protein YeaZ
MSNYLAIDTSSRYLNVLAVKGEKVVQKFIPDCALNHSVRLMQEVDVALTECNLTPQECDFFAAVTGPGSFTGIRIGIATAKGFAVATGKKLVAVTAFDLLAYTVKEPDFLAVVDAAHGHVYTQRFRNGKGQEPCYTSCEDAQSMGLPLIGFEELPFVNYQKIDIAAALQPAIEALKGNACDEMAALYVRKSQAEEGRK